MVDLLEIEASLVDETTKGMPGGLAPLALRDIGVPGMECLARGSATAAGGAARVGAGA